MRKGSIPFWNIAKRKGGIPEYFPERSIPELRQKKGSMQINCPDKGQHSILEFPECFPRNMEVFWTAALINGGIPDRCAEREEVFKNIA